jgi:hypothetical protein
VNRHALSLQAPSGSNCYFNKDTSAQPRRATVYPSDVSGNCKCGQHHSVVSHPRLLSTYVASKAAANRTLFLPNSPYDAQHSRPSRRYRYRDTTCCIDGTPDYRESIYQITISYTTSKGGALETEPTRSNQDDTDNGECSVFIGKE